MSSSTTIECEEVMNIAGVNLLHQDLKSAVNDADEIVLEAKGVEKIDAASLQLIAALFHDSEKLGVDVRWNNPSEAVIESATLLGLVEMLNLKK